MDKHKYSTVTSDHSSYLCTYRLMNVIPVKPSVSNEVHTSLPRPHTHTKTKSNFFLKNHTNL